LKIIRRPETRNLSLLKLILVGLWIGVTTMAAIYASRNLSAAASKLPESAQSKVAEDFKTEHIAVAIFLSGKVRGYFTVRVGCKFFNISNKESLNWILSNDLHKAVYANNEIKYEKIAEGDLDKIAKTLTKYLEERESNLQVTDVKLSEAGFLSRF
jgi:hypothetical protein